MSSRAKSDAMFADALLYIPGGVQTGHPVLDIDNISAVWGSFGLMARKLRVEYPGAVYQVMNRGDRREPIFRDDEQLHGQ